jgi:hypothetical protein
MSPFGRKLAGPVRMNFDLVARAVLVGGEESGLCCPDCEAPMDLHQPDENEPTKLLGACLDCSKWFLVIEAEDPDGRTMLVELPCADRIREAAGAIGAGV